MRTYLPVAFAALTAMAAGLGDAGAAPNTKKGTPERSRACEFDKQSCELVGEDLYKDPKQTDLLKQWYQNCFSAYEDCLDAERGSDRGAVGGPGGKVLEPGKGGSSQRVKPMAPASGGLKK